MIINRDINQSVQHSKSDHIVAGSRTYVSAVYYDSQQPVTGSLPSKDGSHSLVGIFSMVLGSKVVLLKRMCSGDLCLLVYLLLHNFTGLYRGCSGGTVARRTVAL